MQSALEQGRVTSRDIVLQYLTRIATYEDKLNAVIYVNPHSLEEAEARDRERAQGKIRGPLHGIPIALKDNLQTTDMPTTGGALAFDGFVPPYEATLTKNLRDAGAIIIAKTNLTELAIGQPACRLTTTRLPATVSIRMIRVAIRARRPPMGGRR
jgi:amidase